jgi:hypothetical protein
MRGAMPAGTDLAKQRVEDIGHEVVLFFGETVRQLS